MYKFNNCNIPWSNDAVIYRLVRCEKGDVDFLSITIPLVLQNEDIQGFLFYHIEINERFNTKLHLYISSITPEVIAAQSQKELLYDTYGLNDWNILLQVVCSFSFLKRSKNFSFFGTWRKGTA